MNYVYDLEGRDDLVLFVGVFSYNDYQTGTLHHFFNGRRELFWRYFSSCKKKEGLKQEIKHISFCRCSS